MVRAGLYGLAAGGLLLGLSACATYQPAPLMPDVLAAPTVTGPLPADGDALVKIAIDHDPAVAAARASLDAYVTESHRIGRDITRSALFRALHVEGVQNVILAAPAADILISRVQAPHCSGSTVTYAGTDE